jgi:Mg-chelatase subunit ChlD
MFLKTSRLVLGLGLWLHVLGAGGPQAAPQTHALLVLLDVSGSMKESVTGGVKNDLARRGLLATLEAVPAGTLTGLRLLGDGAGDECAASRTAVPVGTFDRPVWEQALDAVPWTGATPLVYSMREALADVRRVDADRREILIIGDGDETCGEDPVGVARAEANGIRIHTISLGEDVSPQLAGIALVTGGRYARAFDEQSFLDASTAAVPSIAPSLPTPAAPASSTPARLEVILDVSNSMWGQVGGRAKIELAREALAGALADLPSTVPVGLRAYGHRVAVGEREAGCQDTERLIVSAPGNGPAIVTEASTLQPRGQTPIARSLEQAAADLVADGGAATILLLTDGVESCGGDPVAVVTQLRASGVPVILHTVGLGVDAADAAALASLAEAGAGTYFNAPTAADLVAGVGEVVRSSGAFVVQEDALSSFPTPITRVRGGTDGASAEVLDAGVYSFADHLFREQRYFAVRGTPGSTVTLRGLVSALEIGRRRGTNEPTFQGTTNMMMAEAIDAAGERLRGSGLIVRGDMGTWVELPLAVGADGFARFRIGRTAGNVHRDMVFSVVRRP